MIWAGTFPYNSLLTLQLPLSATTSTRNRHSLHGIFIPYQQCNITQTDSCYPQIHKNVPYQNLVQNYYFLWKYCYQNGIAQWDTYVVVRPSQSSIRMVVITCTSRVTSLAPAPCMLACCAGQLGTACQRGLDREINVILTETAYFARSARNELWDHRKLGNTFTRLARLYISFQEFPHPLESVLVQISKQVEGK